MPNIVPRRDVQVDGRNYIAGSLYSVDDATVAAIIEAEAAEDGEAATVEVVDELMKHTRGELNDLATEKGVENAEGFANKGEVIEAIHEAEGAAEEPPLTPV